MKIFRKVISCALSPNTDWDDVIRAAFMMLTPWRWKKGKYTAKAAKLLSAFTGGETPIFFDSGRSALVAILNAFNIGSGDEVIVQAFTCVAVPNSVIWAGAKPVFADIDSTLNLDPTSVHKRITSKSKAIIIQHTFGIPADLDSLLSLARKHKLVVIEDCAHALGAVYKGKPVGIFGDAAFYSFGRDKAVSSVWGGAAIIQKKYAVQKEKLQMFCENLPMRGYGWIFSQLLHPIAFSLILASYNMWIGKILLVLLQSLRLLSFPVASAEKRAGKPEQFPSAYPDALAYLLIGQLTKLDALIATRKAAAQQYYDSLKRMNHLRVNTPVPGATYLRYPVFTTNPDSLRLNTKKQGILLGSWYSNIVDPKGVIFFTIGYKPGSCPNAQRAASSVVNLPTRIRTNDVGAVIRSLL